MLLCYLQVYFFTVKNPEKEFCRPPAADPSGAMPRLNTIYVLYNSTPQRQYDRDSCVTKISHRIINNISIGKRTTPMTRPLIMRVQYNTPVQAGNSL